MSICETYCVANPCLQVENLQVLHLEIEPTRPFYQSKQRNAAEIVNIYLVCSQSPQLENMSIEQLRKESHPNQRALQNVSEWFDEMRFWQRQAARLQPARFSEDRQKQTQHIPFHIKGRGPTGKS